MAFTINKKALAALEVAKPTTKPTRTLAQAVQEIANTIEFVIMPKQGEVTLWPKDNGTFGCTIETLAIDTENNIQKPITLHVILSEQAEFVHENVGEIFSVKASFGKKEENKHRLYAREIEIAEVEEEIDDEDQVPELITEKPVAKPARRTVKA
jgi:hypothetical protein